MIYKKHITKNGKKIGSCYYTSLRLKNGKVKSIYLGRLESEKEAKEKEKLVLVHHRGQKIHSPKLGLGVRRVRSPLSSNFQK